MPLDNLLIRVFLIQILQCEIGNLLMNPNVVGHEALSVNKLVHIKWEFWIYVSPELR